MILNVRDQVQHLVTTNDALHANLVGLSKPDSCITDITSGNTYRRLKEEKILRDGDLTVTFNTDGSPLFKSSKSSIWPIQFTLNDLPPLLGFANSTLAGLWFGKKHPNMSLFLAKFVEQFEDIELLK